MSAAPDLFDLSGLHALVTGSTRGLGLVLGRGLAAAGARVAVNGRDRERVEAVAAALRAEGLDAHGAPFDVTDAGEVEGAVGALGPVDVLVNNAGIQRRHPLESFPDADWHAVIETNLTAPFMVSRAVARGMIECGRGKIVNVASVQSGLARPTIAAYASAKGALKMLTQSMCAEWARHGVQANAIGPGYFATEMNAALTADPEFDAWLRARTPAARWGRPEELVGAAVFLASAASDFVNGQILYVDGGLTAVV